VFIVTLTYTVPLEKIDVALDEHIDWLRSQYDRGLFLASGRREPRRGGVILATGRTDAPIRQALLEDPFALLGYAEYSVEQVTVTMTRAGLESLKYL
jgi:uncharacterized protein YciI